MGYSTTLADYMAKARDGAFKDRLRVSLMGKSRYYVEGTADGLSITDARMADIWAYARRIRYLIWSDNWLVSAALHILWSVDTENVDDDDDLDALVSSKFLELSESTLAA